MSFKEREESLKEELQKTFILALEGQLEFLKSLKTITPEEISIREEISKSLGLAQQEDTALMDLYNKIVETLVEKGRYNIPEILISIGFMVSLNEDFSETLDKLVDLKLKSNKN